MMGVIIIKFDKNLIILLINMLLGSIKRYFKVEDQPFKLILIPDKIPQKKDKENEAVINFDEASEAWRKNKISLGEGWFRYKLVN
jgi:hypothetical protein